MPPSKDICLVSTRKGLIVFRKSSSGWTIDGQHFLGIPVTYATHDPRTGTWWACLDHGHWGCKLHRSKDEGKTWEEVTAPAYPEGEEVKEGVAAKLDYIWVLTAGGADQSDRLYMGTVPGGLFQSDDGGDTFELVRGLWDHPSRKEQWFGGGMDHPGIHSICVDPNDSAHVLVGISCAGVFETTDGGQQWSPRNKGLVADFLPDKEAEVGQDPHLLVCSPADFSVQWQQNHCGIFRSTNGAVQWTNISSDNGPANFGFTIAVDPVDTETAWVVPALSDEVRVAVGGALCVCKTVDGGKSWTTIQEGLPEENSFDIVFRHGLDITDQTLAFGTTTGNFYLSEDKGESWTCISHNLPPVYAVRFA